MDMILALARRGARRQVSRECILTGSRRGSNTRGSRDEAAAKEREAVMASEKGERVSEGETGRRDVLKALGLGFLGLAAGAAPSTAEAASGIGYVSSAQAQTGGESPIGPQWWPSRWGADDQAGASNWITPEKILDAIKLVRTGKIYEIGRIYEATMPLFGERVWSIRIPGAPSGGPLGRNRVIWNDEFIATEIGQVGTQFDGLGHIGVAVKGVDQAEMRYYNGFTAADVNAPTGLKKLGMEHVKPILTRGLLLDIQAVRGRNLNLGEEVTVADMEQALQRQNVPAADALKPGDAVFFHTGWGSLWNKDNETFKKGEPGPGMAAAKWLVEKQVCVVGADSWGVEAVPNPDQNLAFPVHQELITKNGIFIHENLDLSQLAADRVSQFLYVMLPLRIKGGTGSPGRPIAVV
jgi:kynurenine formamidase